MKNEDIINEAFNDALATFKPVMYDERHIRIVRLIYDIAKNERLKKQPPSIIKKTNELKKTVVWLIKNDF